MKKIFLRLITGMLAVVCLLGLVACKPRLDIFEAKKNLERAEYYVEIIDGEEIGEFGVEEILYAEDGDEHLQIVYFEKVSLAKKYFKNQKLELKNEIAEVEAEIEYRELVLRKYDKKMSNDEINEYEDQTKLYREELEDLEELLKKGIGRKGKCVWIGTKKAIKASR